MKPLLLLLTALMIAGCQTTSQRELPVQTSRSRNGQLQYSTASRSIIGNVTVNTAPDFQLQFTAGPGMPLLNIARSGDRASAEGLLVRAAMPLGQAQWNGAPGAAPEGLITWLSLAAVFAGERRDSFASAPGATPAWRATATASRVDVRFPSTGERFRFVFAQ